MAETVPTAGDKAPDFTVAKSGGGTVSLADFKGKTLVLFFYPRDDTSGCTKEAIGFSQAQEAFAKAGAAILGASRDSVASHDKFIAKHALTVPLASDEDGAMSRAYGVWVEKNMYGKVHMGIERSTFVIRDGRILRAWRKVRVPGHVDDVLDAVQGI